MDRRAQVFYCCLGIPQHATLEFPAFDRKKMGLLHRRARENALFGTTVDHHACASDPMTEIQLSDDIPLSEAWPRWLSVRYPRAMRKILDPETYRPDSLVTRTTQVGRDVVTGCAILDYEPPDERALAHANSLLFIDSARHDVDGIEAEFWLGFCNRSSDWAEIKYPR